LNEIKKVLLIGVVSLTLTSCHNTTTKSEPTVEDKRVFYPSILNQDIKIDSYGELTTMYIKQVFQERLPNELLETLDSHCNHELSEKGSTYLVIPSNIHKNEPLHIDMYGCWIDYAFFVDIGISYKGFFVNISDNIVNFEAQQITWNEQEAPAIEEQFHKQQSEEINGTWSNGELQFKVHNPNGEEIISIITIN